MKKLFAATAVIGIMACNDTTGFQTGDYDLDEYTLVGESSKAALYALKLNQTVYLVALVDDYPVKGDCLIKLDIGDHRINAEGDAMEEGACRAETTSYAVLTACESDTTATVTIDKLYKFNADRICKLFPQQ